MSKLWMTRKLLPLNGTNVFVLDGPFSQDEILKRFKERKFSVLDEVGVQNAYWFSLSDVTEVKKYFGEETLTFLMTAGEGVAQAEKTITELDPEKTLTDFLSKPLPKEKMALEKKQDTITITDLNFERKKCYEFIFLIGVVLAALGIFFLFRLLKSSSH